MKTLPLRVTSGARTPAERISTSPVARWGALGLAALLAACAATPSHPPPARHARPAAQPMYFYPQHGQSERRQDRDRYECYQWATRQTRSDPGMTPLRSVRSGPDPDPAPGRDTAIGAATGAAIGAMVASPHHAGEGAVAGLILGALIGASSDQARAEQWQAQAAARDRGRAGPWHDFRRAMSACMTGRGYTVG